MAFGPAAGSDPDPAVFVPVPVPGSDAVAPAPPAAPVADGVKGLEPGGLPMVPPVTNPIGFVAFANSEASEERRKRDQQRTGVSLGSPTKPQMLTCRAGELTMIGLGGAGGTATGGG